MEDYVKRYVSNDGTYRITIHYEDYAENPRYTTDEPLHCEDWNRDYSIMITEERTECCKSSNARSCLNWFIREHGDHKKILDTLIKGGKNMDETDLCDVLVYDKHEKQWILYSHGFHYDYEQKKNVKGWFKYDTFSCRKDELDTYEIIDMLGDDSIDYIVKNCMTDGIKLASYSFGYHGSISFDDEVTCKSDGIAWLEKDEFLKYAGGDNSEWVKKEEEVWKTKPLSEITWMLKAIEAWCDNEVYWYETEKRATFHVRKECTSEDRPVLDYDTEEWEQKDTCCGFYGDVEYYFEHAVENTPFKKEDFSEVIEKAA